MRTSGKNVVQSRESLAAARVKALEIAQHLRSADSRFKKVLFSVSCCYFDNVSICPSTSLSFSSITF